MCTGHPTHCLAAAAARCIPQHSARRRRGPGHRWPQHCAHTARARVPVSVLAAAPDTGPGERCTGWTVATREHRQRPARSRRAGPHPASPSATQHSARSPQRPSVPAVGSWEGARRHRPRTAPRPHGNAQCCHRQQQAGAARIATAAKSCSHRTKRGDRRAKRPPSRSRACACGRAAAAVPSSHAEECQRRS